jgi:hypothetical protein
MSEANNALKIKYHGVTLVQTEGGKLLSMYTDDGDELDYPTLTNAQANYISTELCKRIRAAMTGLIEELREAKAGGLDMITKPGSGLKG